MIWAWLLSRLPQLLIGLGASVVIGAGLAGVSRWHWERARAEPGRGRHDRAQA